MAIVPFRIADTIKETNNVKKFESAFGTQLENYLTQTRRFAMLDRKIWKNSQRIKLYS